MVPRAATCGTARSGARHRRHSPAGTRKPTSLLSSLLLVAQVAEPAGHGADLCGHPVGQLVPPALAQVNDVEVVLDCEVTADVKRAEPAGLEHLRHLAMCRDLL